MLMHQQFRRVAVLWSVLCGVTAFGQTESGRGAILGTVADPTGRAVSGASIELRSRETAYTRKVTSGADGRFSAPVLPVGEYSLEATAPGFAKSMMESLKLDVGEA